jgi:uncharacterized protein (DUF697 family)
MSDATLEAEAVEVPRDESATAVVRRHSAYAAGTSLIPVPLVDLVATSGVQVKMVRDLAGLYEVEFSPDAAKSVISALIGTLGAQQAAVGASSLVKVLPFIGPVASTVVAPGLAGAVTYGLGQVFIRHFSMGGTLLTFDVEKMRAYFKEEVEQGKSSTKAESAAKRGATASKDS